MDQVIRVATRHSLASRRSGVSKLKDRRACMATWLQSYIANSRDNLHVLLNPIAQKGEVGVLAWMEMEPCILYM